MTVPTLADFLAALPWIAVPCIALWRTRGTRSLADYSADAPADAPPVSVIVPARNEAHNIARCVRSILDTSYPLSELIVVDDHSTDGTADRARSAADGDARLRIIENDPLPEGWFGKQWACFTGARHATGELLLFADADTAHAPDLLPRLVAAQRDMRADLISVAGRQELGSFWERIVQPQIFSLLFIRYGGTEGVNRARRAVDVIANGQCLMVTREAYDALGGHDVVKHVVAEDLRIAQAMFTAGRQVRLVVGIEQLSTRMYTSLRELVAGWGKNVYAGGIDSVPLGRVGRLLCPLRLLLVPVMGLWPPVSLALAAMGVISASHFMPALIATMALVLWFTLVYVASDEPPWYALLFPLGAVVLFYIFAGAIARGRRVAWKGRSYITER